MRPPELDRFLLVLAGIFVFPATVCAEEILEQNGISLHSMQEFTEAGGDCGCYFYYPGKPEETAFILYWPYSEGDAVIKINGKLENMKVLSDESNDADKYKNHIRFSLGNDTTLITGSCKSTWICPEDSESCEITKYAGSIHVKHDSSEIEVPVEGACGC